MLGYIRCRKDLEGFKHQDFNFRKLHVLEVMAEIMRCESIVYDLYSKIYSSMSKDPIKRLWRGNEPEHYFRLIKWLLGEEKSHMKLFVSYAGQIARIY